MRFYNFLVYDVNTKQLLYTKYNFNFSLYASDFAITSNSKLIIFADFWKRNNYNDLTPFVVYESYKKYFTSMTNEIKTYVSSYGNMHCNYIATFNPNLSDEYLYEHQFDMIAYEENQMRRTQDFIYSVNVNYSYTKYNFDFDLYSYDFNIFDTKLVLFTDFIVRNNYTSNVIIPSSGYGFNDFFSKYFDTKINLNSYLFTYSVNSILSYADKNINSIDFGKYIETQADIPKDWSIEQAINHYLTFGQFEQRIIPFIKKQFSGIELTKHSVCSVFLKNKTDTPLATGFLYDNNDGLFYIVTCYHIIKNFRDQRYIYAILENDNTTQIAQFKIIGYDYISDVMVALYDHTLNFNVVNNVDISSFTPLKINYNYNGKISDEISIIGNIEYDDNLAYVGGKIMNPVYGGGFDINNSINTIPESYLIQTFATYGMSGAPILLGETSTTNNRLECIGLLIGGLKKSSQIAIALSSYVLLNVIKTIIINWSYIDLFNITDQQKIDNIVKNGYPKSWLGVINKYNHPILAKQHKELANLSYIGGLLLTNFIIGFNIRDEKFVYSSNDLLDSNVIKLTGPLLKTKLYSNFIKNGSVPIVLTTIKFFNSLSSEFVVLHVGKFGSQDPYSDFIYGMSSISTYNISGFNNSFKYEFAPITLEYWYYNGSVWKFEIETIGGNEPNWYITYIDNAGNSYYQHLFEFPQILIPYINDYSISTYATIQQFDTNVTQFDLNKYKHNNMKNLLVPPPLELG